MALLETSPPPRRGVGTRCTGIGRMAAALLLARMLAPQPLAASHPGEHALFSVDAGDEAPVQPLHGRSRIPAFSRRYGTSCSTCHVAPGKLNAQGEAFRLNGYRFPDEDERIRREEPVPLAAEPWKDLWPEAVWPGEIPGSLPLSLFIANDVRITSRASGPLAADLLFPAVVGLQAGTSLGETIGVLFVAVWTPGGGIRMEEAFIALQNPVPWLPRRALNVWVGSHGPHLTTFGDPSLDRALRQPFTWSRLRPSDWIVEDTEPGRMLSSESPFDLSRSRPSLELNGLAGSRLYYGLGLAQPSAPGAAEFGRDTDVYFKLRYKFGGMGLDGSSTPGREPVAWGGQLLDQGVIIEQFVYSGATALPSGARDEHRSFGIAARVIHRKADIGAGHVRGRHSNPWEQTGRRARHESLFGRAEYLVFPWLVASLKLDRTRVRATTPGPDPEPRPLERARVLPGAAILLRHNVRIITEAELFLRERPRIRADGQRSDALWVRLDVSF